VIVEAIEDQRDGLILKKNDLGFTAYIKGFHP